MEPSLCQQCFADMLHSSSKSEDALTQKSVDARQYGMDNLRPNHYLLCSAAQLKQQGCRVHSVVNGRRVSVLRTDSGLHCIDSLCYHGAGPLTSGDIEEVNGRECIVCPWHGYKVTLDTGEKLYRSTVFIDGKPRAAGWQSVGSRQRVHLAYEEDGQVIVRLNLTDVQVESDKYAYRERGA